MYILISDGEKNNTGEKNMKKRLSGILLGMVFLLGFGIFLYPTAADQWNQYHQSKAIASYEDMVSDMTQEDFQDAWEAARNYNEKIIANTFSGEVFSQEEKKMKETEYWSVLNLGGNGIMGYVSIPKIKQNIPIYHGTSDPVLQIGAGHILGTKLPIGGAGAHSVLAAHRGLPSAKLFTDIDQLTVGDKFYVHILDEVLAYEVDQILPMVEKEDTQTLSNAMQNEPEQDYMTLFTCTPYGVNSHRLLVRGHRAAYHGEEEETVNTEESMLQLVKDYYMLYALLAVAVSILVSVMIRVLRNMKKASGKEKK